MIRLENVSFWYSMKAPILKDFSLTINDGERILLSGRSGIGKSTVLRLIMGLEKPRRGEILAPDKMRISAVFQENRLIPWKTVYDNIALFWENDPNEPGMKDQHNLQNDMVMKLLSDLGLESAAGQFPEELSGGMKRRVALARALAHPSDLLILDEAYTGLDDTTKEQALTVTDREIAGRTVLMATHDLDEAKSLRARIVELSN